MWFETLVGFVEGDVEHVAARFVVEGDRLRSLANGRTMTYGRFECPSLGELRHRMPVSAGRPRALPVSEVVADVGALHVGASNAGALFQVASQFNALEMSSPDVVPEDGITRYAGDRTQGPACAIACGAGSIYRNYLVPLGDRVGQSADRQIDGLAELAAALGVTIPMRNGYALASAEQLDVIARRLDGVDEPARDALMAHLRIAVQWDTEVTLANAGHLVTQAFCSGLPIAYSSHAPARWEPFARLVLDAAYEATLACGLVNAASTGNNRVFLTLVGGGVFGNPSSWIVDSIERALRLFSHADLEVVLVSHGTTNSDLGRVMAPPPSWVDGLFAEPPAQWGLRGDPLLWAELRAVLARSTVPATSIELERRIVGELRRLCGVDLTTTELDAVRIARFPGGGMSGGLVDPATWRRLIAVLVGRLGS
jgi:hypothetical protein